MSRAAVANAVRRRLPPQRNDTMGKILEFITVNVAARDVEAALVKWRAMGLASLPPSHMPAPPAEITDVTLPIGLAGAVLGINRHGMSEPIYDDQVKFRRVLNDASTGARQNLISGFLDTLFDLAGEDRREHVR